MARRMVKIRRRSPSRAEEALSFRIAMPVTEVALFRSGERYPVCPKCRVTLAREYQGFCDRCGQHLSWSGFSRAAITTKF